VPPGPAEEASTWAPMRAWRRRRRRAARSPFGALRDASPAREVSPAGATVTMRAGTAASDGCLPCRRPRARGGVAHPRAVKEAGSWCGTGAPQGCLPGNTAGVRHDRGKRGRWPPLWVPLATAALVGHASGRQHADGPPSPLRGRLTARMRAVRHRGHRCFRIGRKLVLYLFLCLLDLNFLNGRNKVGRR
jgi:hypothetical protein